MNTFCGGRVTVIPYLAEFEFMTMAHISVGQLHWLKFRLQKY